MVDRLVLAVTGQSDLAAAWNSLVSPNDKVGIKISAAGGDEKQLGVLRFHPIGTFYDVSPKGEIVYVRFNPGKSELWLADFPRP